MASKITADRILALDTADVAAYLSQHLGVNGVFTLENIDGWDVLPKTRRAELGDKLRSAALEASSSIAAHGGLTEFAAQLISRLGEIKDGVAKSSSQTVSFPESERSPTPPPHPNAIKHFEIAAYHELIDDAGRPPFALDLLDTVAENPRGHHEMLRPWAADPDLSNPDDWRVFSLQRDRWQDFRKWQRDNRNASDDEGYLAFLEATKRRIASTGAVGETTQPRFEEVVKTLWKQDERNRQCRRETIRENHGNGGFSGYIEAARRRLAEHGFAQQFQFEEDSRRQDARVTWIEYIEFECWWLDNYTISAERLQPQHDHAWKTLLDSGALVASETPENLCTAKAREEREKEEVQAEKILKVARKVANLSMEVTDTMKLREAEKSLHAIQDRNFLINQFILNTKIYRNARKDARRQGALVRWALEQMTLVEAEFEQRKAAKDHADVPRNRKRGRLVDQQEAEKPNLKRQRRGDGNTPDHDRAQGRRSKRRGHIGDLTNTKSLTKNVTVTKTNQNLEPVAREEVTVEKLNTGTAKKAPRTSQRSSVSPPCAAGLGNTQRTALKSRVEWMKVLRKRSPSGTMQQSTALGRRSKTQADAAKGVKRKYDGRAGPESTNDVHA